ncbi:MAG: acetate kinase, partial [Trueperaceae bacterium]|nr:acetate kinase [Trueperaceae bacterium]
EGLSVDEVDDLLNKGSGLKGMSGVSNDVRDVSAAAAAGGEGAAAALDVFAYRVRKVVGAYAAVLGGLDAVVFTGGIGENSAALRGAALAGLEFLGVTVDEARNARGETTISAEGARVAVLVVPTDEELMIADAAATVLRASHEES